MKRGYQRNVAREEDADPRKYEVGRLLTFQRYNPDETACVPCSTFRRGDVLCVMHRNKCGMGIDVRRVSDGRSDMVWPEEVTVRRTPVRRRRR